MQSVDLSLPLLNEQHDQIRSSRRLPTPQEVHAVKAFKRRACRNWHILRMLVRRSPRFAAMKRWSWVRTQVMRSSPRFAAMKKWTWRHTQVSLAEFVQMEGGNDRLRAAFTFYRVPKGDGVHESFLDDPAAGDGIFQFQTMMFAFHSVMYCVASFIMLWTVCTSPSWWMQVLDSIGLVPLSFQIPGLWFAVVVGPCKYLANFKLWRSGGLGTFLVSKDKNHDDKFQEEIDKLIKEGDVRHLSYWWGFSFFVIPLVVFLLSPIPHWQWVTLYVVIPHAIRSHFTESSSLPFNMAVLCTRFRVDLELELVRDMSVYGRDPATSSAWEQVCRSHQKLVLDLESLWNEACLPLVIGIVESGSAAMIFASLGYSTSNSTVAMGFFLLGLSLGLNRLRLLVPVAKATSTCEEIGRVASTYVTDPRTMEATAAYMKAIQYLAQNPAGVRCPKIGIINWSLVATKLMPLITSFPALLAVARQHLEAETA